MPTWTRPACALAAFPVGWALREAIGGAAGGVMVLALIAACARGLPQRSAIVVVVAGVLCFVAVHMIAAVTSIYAGLAVGSLAFFFLCLAVVRP